MLSGVSTVCFAASYAVALALEISRLRFRSSVRGVVMLGFAAAGFVAHSAFLYHRAVNAVGAPLSSERDWYLLAAWALVAVYLYMAVLHRTVPFGVFLLPLALAFIVLGTFVAPDVPLTQAPASKVWGAIHGVSIVLAAVSVLVGFVAGLMYLGQMRRLKQKRPSSGGLGLPSLEWLQQINGRAILVSTIMLGAGVLSGMVLNRILASNAAQRVPWSDPVVLSTWLMFLWLLAATLFGAFYRPAQAGRKVAYLTLASFLFLAIVLAVGLLVNSRHWGRGERGEGREGRALQRAATTAVHFPLVVCPSQTCRLGVTAGLYSSAGNTVGQANRGARHFRSVGAPATIQYSLPSPLSPVPSPLSPLPFLLFPGGPPC